MSNYTEHHHLHQWEPGDPFLRTDFNEDFAKIDGALDGLAQAHADLNYHLYNLLLQNDYEGKYTGFKRAMLFDGFRDGSGIQSKSGFFLARTGLVVGRTGQRDISLGYGPNSVLEAESLPMAVTACGTVSGFRFKLYASTSVSEAVAVTGTLSVNGSDVRTSTQTFDPPASGKNVEKTFVLPETDVAPGDVCILRLKSANSRVSLFKDTANTRLGGVLTVTPKGAVSGTMTGKPLPLPAGGGAAAWVRHKGGAVGLALRADGTERTFAPESARAVGAVRDGTLCTEQAFRLDGPIRAGETQVVLTGALGDSEDGMTVYDYGVVVL